MNVTQYHHKYTVITEASIQSRDLPYHHVTSGVDVLPFLSSAVCWTSPGAPWGEGTPRSPSQVGSLENDRASASSPCAYDCQGTFQRLGDDPVIN